MKWIIRLAFLIFPLFSTGCYTVNGPLFPRINAALTYPYHNSQGLGHTWAYPCRSGNCGPTLPVAHVPVSSPVCEGCVGQPIAMTPVAQGIPTGMMQPIILTQDQLQHLQPSSLLPPPTVVPPKSNNPPADTPKEMPMK